MPDLFSPYTLKGVTLRNRIAMSPMTMHRSVDGKMNDYHVMLMGSRAAGGFGLVFPEQIAITPDGRTSASCAGIWSDDQVDGLSRMCAIVKEMGGVPAIQLGHTGRKGSEQKPWEGKQQIAPDDEHGWQVRGPSAITYGGRYTYPVQELSVAEIRELHQAYADAARRALAAGFEWLEMHFAHGYLGASFFSPLANQRTDEYGGSLENRLRFHREALDAVRAVWPDRLPLTMRLGSDDFHPDGVQFDDSVWAVGELKQHGLDLADMSLGMNTDELHDPPFSQAAFMVERGNRVKREVGIPVAVSWNLGTPAVADRVIREELIDLVFLGRPALANPHWPVWAARELAHNDPFSMLPQDWSWWLHNRPGSENSHGWPAASVRLTNQAHENSHSTRVVSRSNLMAGLYRLLYCSRSVLTNSPDTHLAEIGKILATARRNNSKLDITGGLLFSDDCFVQVLEGSVRNVERVFERISMDERHADVTVLQRMEVDGRDFVSWSMAFADQSAGCQVSSAAKVDPVFLTGSTGGRSTLGFMQEVVRTWKQLLYNEPRKSVPG